MRQRDEARKYPAATKSVIYAFHIGYTNFSFNRLNIGGIAFCKLLRIEFDFICLLNKYPISFNN